jgi:hypothetical protein
LTSLVAPLPPFLVRSAANPWTHASEVNRALAGFLRALLQAP